MKSKLMKVTALAVFAVFAIPTMAVSQAAPTKSYPNYTNFTSGALKLSTEGSREWTAATNLNSVIQNAIDDNTAYATFTF